MGNKRETKISEGSQLEGPPKISVHFSRVWASKDTLEKYLTLEIFVYKARQRIRETIILYFVTEIYHKSQFNFTSVRGA